MNRAGSFFCGKVTSRNINLTFIYKITLMMNVKWNGFFIAAVLCLIALLAGCGSHSGDTVEIKGNGVWDGAFIHARVKGLDKNRREVHFGVTPWQGREKMKSGFTPILAYLSRKTGLRFVLHISPDYATLKNDLKDNHIQVAAFSAGAYGEALREMKNRMKYIVTTAQVQGDRTRDYYYGYIVTRKDSGIRSIQELKNLNFGFVDEGSSSGYKYPVTAFIKRGFLPEHFFKQTFFLGSHSKVTDGVAERRVHAGATHDLNYKRALKKHGRIFRIIYKTPAIPFDAWVASEKMSDQFVRKLRRILVSMPESARSPNGGRIFRRDDFAYTGFVKRSSDFYQVIIETQRLLKQYRASREKKAAP